MKEGPPQPTEHDPFWHLDGVLGELELMERPSGPDPYTVRLKARTATTPYHPRTELYPLAYRGTEHEIAGKAYILVPNITLTVGLYPAPHLSSGAIGRVTDTQWEGMRHQDIASVRGLYYQDDQALAIWEVDTWGRLDAFAHGRLWHLFERFLIHRFPDANRIFTDDSEPFERVAHNQEFLTDLGYQSVAGHPRILAKTVVSR